MSADEKAVLIRGFRAIDRKGKGVIGRKEIVRYLKGHGMTSSEANKKANEMFTILDPRKTGKISLNDYIRGRTLGDVEHSASSSALAKRALAILDPKKTGVVDADHLDNELKKATPQQERRRIMAKINAKTNNDGKVTVDDLHKIMNHGKTDSGFIYINNDDL